MIRRTTVDPGARWRNPQAVVKAQSARLAALPTLFIVWYSGLDSEANRILVARYSMALLGQHMGGPSATHQGEAAHLNDVRARHPTIRMMAYLQVAHESLIAESPGVGNDRMALLADTAWLRDAGGTPYFITWNSQNYRLYDYRLDAWREAFLAAADLILQQYPWDGLFLDNCTASWAAHQAVHPGALRGALHRALTELRRRHPEVLLIGNCIERWDTLNGKMVEGRRDDWDPELLPPFSYRPRADLVMEYGYTDENDPDLDTDLATVRDDYGAWFAAVSGTPTSYANLPWPPAFQSYVDDFGVPGYVQKRVSNSGTRYLQKLGHYEWNDAFGVDVPHMTFSCWVKLAVLGTRQPLITDMYEQTVPQPGAIESLNIEITATGKVYFRHRNDTLGDQCGPVETAVAIADTNWHFIKIVVTYTDLSEGTLSITLDSTTETWDLVNISNTGFMNFGTGNIRRNVLASVETTPSVIFNGAIADMVWDNKIITDGALSYNSGVPLSVAHIDARIKITGKTAAAFAAHEANGNGGSVDSIASTIAGKRLTSVGTGDWGDV